MIHVYPIDDLREHEISVGCRCQPSEEGDGVVVHNSMDRREEYEAGNKTH